MFGNNQEQLQVTAFQALVAQTSIPKCKKLVPGGDAALHHDRRVNPAPEIRWQKTQRRG